ncbi:cell wall protein [Streptomyces sp. NBC_00385]|uniref:cell wall protein n=1 Tax=Streptomyces sp. NBC_00385 TaxID=2975733 RepID=UPI002DD8FF51|nr:cell wall protein [Streptomyces sp. NBC_00385]WRZ06332.1 cell wall protein [Streptomyces sp. NBC_00385]
MSTTAARHAQPRAWLRAVVWLVEEARLHPRAGEATLRIARDLAGRMDYTAGTVLYDLDGTAARCALSRATVKRHVGYLRELGALVWLRHGSRRNLRLPGRPYAGTATIYAATIPYAYDRAHGNRIDGQGFGARVVGVPVVPVQTLAAGGSGRRGREPQSLAARPRKPVVEVDGAVQDTPRRRERPRTASPPENSTPRSPLQVAADIRTAAQVRPHVPWTQGEGLRRLAYALRPLIDQGLNAHDIAAELTSWWINWRPARPAAYITAQLRNRTGVAPHEDLAAEAAHQHAAGPAHNPAWQAWLRQRATATECHEPQRTDDDRRHARLYGWDRWVEIAEHYAADPDDALDLYGTRLCGYAVKRASEIGTGVQTHAS